MAAIQEILIDSANGNYNDKKLNSVCDNFKKDVQKEKLAIQLKMFQNARETYNSIKGENVRVVTSMSTIINFMNFIPGAKIMFSEIDKLIKLYVVVPFTSCTSERSFSALRYIKNYMRSSMTQIRLNHVMILFIYKNRTRNLMAAKIAHEFIHSKSSDTRMLYFGNR